MKSRMRKISRPTLFISAATASVIMIAGWLFFSRESLEAATNNIYEGLLAGDGEVIAHYINRQEAAAYGLSGEEYTKLLQSEFTPLLREWHPLDDPVKEYRAPEELYSHLYRFSSGSNNVALLRVEVARTPDGPRAVGLISNLMACMGTMRYRAPKEFTGKTMIFYGGAQLARNDGERLSQLGLKGIYNRDTKEFTLWPDMANRLERLLVMIAEKRKTKANQESKL